MKRVAITRSGRRLYYSVILACLSTAAAAHAGSHQYGPDPALYIEECGSCHVPYPPQRMTQAGWETQMRNLQHHFGTDASMDDAARKTILSFLVTNASLKEKNAPTEPTARLTKTRGFVKEHGNIPPKSLSFSNCSGCHMQAEKGDFGERTLKTPAGWRHDD